MDEAISRDCCLHDAFDDASQRNQMHQHHTEQQHQGLEDYRIELRMNADDTTTAFEHTRTSNFVVAVRPPRAPKHSMSIHNDPLQQQYRGPESTQLLSRSTSQPRASVLLSDNSAQTIAISSSSSSVTRSASQPRASNHGHFLHGFNVADCFDVRSIPDPPSPAQQHVVRSSSSSKRRVSTAMMLPRLGDVTNRGGGARKDNHNNMGGTEFTKTTTNTKNNGSVANRKRKSLAHVPSPTISPIVLDQRDDPFQCDRGREQHKDSEMVVHRPRTLQVELCLESNEEDDDGGMRSRVSPKRRKKRQSMVIPDPRTLQVDIIPSQQEDSLSAYGLPSNTRQNPSKAKQFFPGDMQSLMGLRKLVHEYCALPEEKRTLSEQATAIRETTGYALLSSPQDVFTSTNSSSNDILANRRLVLQKISPVMMQMEKRRGHEIKQWEQDTGCRVEKSTRSGKYKYYCIESNQRVSTQEYSKRYMLVIEGREGERKAWTKTWMDKLHLSTTAVIDDESKANFTQESLILDNKNNVAGEHVESSESSALEEVVHDEMIFRSDFSENEDRQREAFLPPMPSLSRSSSTASNGRVVDSLDPSVLRSSFEYVEHGRTNETSNTTFQREAVPSTTSVTMSTTEREGPAEISEASSEDTDESPYSRSSSPDLTIAGGDKTLPVDGFVSERDVKGSCYIDQLSEVNDGDIHGVVAAMAQGLPLMETEGTPFLPFPSRDVESADPDIALAESRLWDKIDLALQEYSADVVMIMKSKKHIGNREQSASIAM
jgi:hypothetical protein